MCKKCKLFKYNYINILYINILYTYIGLHFGLHLVYTCLHLTILTDVSAGYFGYFGYFPIFHIWEDWECT